MSTKNSHKLLSLFKIQEMKTQCIGKMFENSIDEDVQVTSIFLDKVLNTAASLLYLSNKLKMQYCRSLNKTYNIVSEI